MSFVGTRCHSDLDTSHRLSFDRSALGPVLIFCTLTGLLASFSWHLFGDGDTGWHIGAGRYMLQTLSIPHADPFSYTYRGEPWIAHEWLAEVVMAALFNVGSWRLLALLFGLAATATMLLIGRELARWIPGRWVLVVLLCLAIILTPYARARPHVLAWPLLAGWLLILLHSRERKQAPPLAAAAIMLAWANLHASYMIGLGIAGLFAAEAAIDQRREWPVLRGWAAFMALSLIAACVTPQGPGGFLYPFEVSGMQSLTVIGEWQPTRLPDDALFLLSSVAVWLLLLWRWRQAPPLRALLLAALTWLALTHGRHQMIFAIVAPLIAAPLVGALIRKQASMAFNPVWLGGSAVALIALRLLLPVPGQALRNFPMAAIDRVPPAIRAEPVFNDYSYGGPLILAGIPPYIDGRADMYGDAFTLDYVSITNGDMKLFRRAQRRWRFGWAIMPANAILAKRLATEPGWAPLYRDDRTVVFEAQRQ